MLAFHLLWNEGEKAKHHQDQISTYQLETMSALEKPIPQASIKPHPSTVSREEEVEAAVELLFEIALHCVTSDSQNLKHD